MRGTWTRIEWCVGCLDEEDLPALGTLSRRPKPFPSCPQIVRTFRIETRKASKAVARRKVRPFSRCLGLTQRKNWIVFPIAFIFRSGFYCLWAFLMAQW